MGKRPDPLSLTMRWERALVLCQLSDAAGAARELAALLERDPERPQAWQTLAKLCAAQGLERAAEEYQSLARSLSSDVPQGDAPPGDSELGRAYRLLAQGQAAQALAMLQAALAAGQGNHPSVMLAAKAAWQAGQIETARSTSQAGLYYWPMSVPMHLIMANCLTQLGEHDLAVEHIRLVRSLDPKGEVEIGKPAPAISSQSAASGKKQADSPPPNTELEHDPADETVRAVRESLAQVTRSLDAHPRPPKARKPFQAIISAREPLAQLCGSSATVVEEAMTDLAATITRYDGIAAAALLVDDAASLSAFGLAPVQSYDAASISRLLNRLDDALEMRGLQLTSVLIVGGDEIIPFHRLPNPTEDPDTDVPTDAPYSRCEAAEGQPNDLPLPTDRLIGRVPHSAPMHIGQTHPTETLLLQLGAALQTRVESAHSGKGANGLLRWLMGYKNTTEPLRSFGYAASVWRKAAQQVFGVIGPAQAMRLSPPLGGPDMLELLTQTRPQLAYFNLHGLPDSPYWYGQRDPEFAADYAPFPVALSPSDIAKPVRVVFTAACYGAHLFGRSVSTSIALRFMELGTLALVGSTTVAYGGLDKPLVGVDLLAWFFWQHIVNGCSSGNALRQAKLDFAQQVQDRQGYLDGEDQKTLSSFILLGDPLLAPLTANGQPISHNTRKQAVLQTDLLRATDRRLQNAVAVPEAQVHKVKQYVAHSLPEMAQAAVQNSEFKIRNSEFKMVSLSKTVPYADRSGMQLVRVTLDGAGKIVKLAMSK